MGSNKLRLCVSAPEKRGVVQRPQGRVILRSTRMLRVAAEQGQQKGTDRRVPKAVAIHLRLDQDGSLRHWLKEGSDELG